jgi:hypothetical protein
MLILDCTVIEPDGRSYYSEGMEFTVKTTPETVLLVALEMMKAEALPKDQVYIDGNSLVHVYNGERWPATYVYKYNGKHLSPA